jgi:hypothetical protein
MTHSGNAIWPSSDPQDFYSSFSTAKSEETEWYVSSLFRILFPMTCVENNVANRSFNAYVSHPTHSAPMREREGRQRITFEKKQVDKRRDERM